MASTPNRSAKNAQFITITEILHETLGLSPRAMIGYVAKLLINLTSDRKFLF
jgi:hypothetical protein